MTFEGWAMREKKLLEFGVLEWVEVACGMDRFDG
jgi:hypothetical protein